jgi:hypothetical protein
MAIFNPSAPPAGANLRGAVQAVRTILAANKYIKQEVDRQVNAANPQTTNAWETVRGVAIKQAMKDNILFRTAVRADPAAGPFIDPAI